LEDGENLVRILLLKTDTVVTEDQLNIVPTLI
jgi:hypothetical protein